MHDWLAASRRARRGGERLDQFLILVVDRHRQPGLRDLAERREHGRMIDAREAHGVVLICREFERGDAAGREAGDRIDAAMLQDRAVQRHVHMRRALHPADLVGKDRRIGHWCGHVVRHVAAGRNTACRRAARGTFDAGPAGGRRGVHVAIDQSGQNEVSPVVDGFLRWRQRALADRSDRLAAHCDIAVVDDAGGGDHRADNHPIEWR